MYIPVKVRKSVYDKYNGKCAYSGTKLKDDWQVDHLVPVRIIKTLEVGKRHVMGWPEDPNDINNLMPTQRILNHYKRCLTIKEFKSWYLGGLHKRLKKLPKNPRVEKSIRHKQYLLEVASYFNITVDKPFSGKLYYEQFESIRPVMDLEDSKIYLKSFIKKLDKKSELFEAINTILTAFNK